MELGIDPEDLTNPWHAAGASFIAFTVGALLPLLAIVLPPASWCLPVTVVSVLIALALTGWGSARLGAAPPRPAVLRNMAGGALADGGDARGGAAAGGGGGLVVADEPLRWEESRSAHGGAQVRADGEVRRTGRGSRADGTPAAADSELGQVRQVP